MRGSDGPLDGNVVGCTEGRLDCDKVGRSDGDLDGNTVGCADGVLDGDKVG